MAAGEDKDNGDPIERAIRRKAEQQAASKPTGSALAAATKSAAAAGRTFYDPSPADEPAPYKPSEGSFFGSSAEERAEQARRAAQRVRRRIKGDDDEPRILSRSAPAEELAPEPTIAAPKDLKPTSRGSLMDRAMAGKPKKADSVETAELHQPFKPESVLSAALKPAIPTKSILDRATEPPKPAPPKIPVLTKAERRLAEKLNPAPEPKVEPAAKPAPAPDLIARSAERAAKPAPVAAPAEAPASIAKKVGAAALAQRAAGLAKAKATNTVKSAPTAKEAPPPKARVVEKPASPPPSPRTAPVDPLEAAFTDKASDLAADVDPLAAAYVDADTAPDSVYSDEPVVIPTSGIKTARTKAFAPFEWMIASRYLRARKKEGFVSVIAGFSLVGIALGVATLIVVMAVMTGFRETLITQIVGGSPHISVTSQAEKFENFDPLADQIRSVDGVEYVTPIVQGQVLGTGRRGHSGVIVRGMRKADLEHLIETADPEVTNGSLDEFTDNTVALGANLAARLGLRVGDFITLISPDGDITPFSATPMPRTKDYRIIYTFRLGVQEVDYGVAFMPFEEAQIYFNKQGIADTLDVFVDNPQGVSDSLRNIQPGSYEEEIFGAARSSISINNWKNQNGRLIGAINLERQVMFVILTMIILVASLNIISGLVMLVKDKARDVAIMRTMGMARGSIMRIFFICGSSIGVIGSLAGVILGVLFVWNIHSIQGGVEWITGTQVWDPGVRAGIEKIPTKLQFSDVALTLFIALGLSFIATLFPAWKAAKLDPVEALRYE